MGHEAFRTRSASRKRKKIWITEFGQPTGTSTGAVTEDRQSVILLDFLQRASKVQYLGPPFVFTSKDLSDDPTVHLFNYGLYPNNYDPKPVVRTLQAWSSGTPGGQ